MPMQKRTRRFLFWIAVIIFGAASYIAILYAQGYKYDLIHHAFVRTGAIAVTVNTDAQVDIGGTSLETTSFLSHTTGKNRLLPDTYAVKVTREGYSSWTKVAAVQEGLLTDFPHVLLLPLDRASSLSLQADIAAALKSSRTLADATPLPTPSATPTPSPRPRKTPTPTPVPLPTAIASGAFSLRNDVLYQTIDGQDSPLVDQVLGFQVTEDNSRVLWWTRTEVWVLWLTNTNYQPYRSANEREVITRFVTPITRAAWFRDNDHVVVDLGLESYRILETDTRGPINIIKI